MLEIRKKTELQENKGNTRKTYHIINDVLRTDKIRLDINEQTIEDQKLVTGKFNQYSIEDILNTT